MDSTTSMDIRIAKKKRNEKIELILNHQVMGEVYIAPPARQWKRLVLKQYNKVEAGEMTLKELCLYLQKNGVVFLQSLSLVQYPVTELLYFIAKVSKRDLTLNGECK